jgi:drug/metabolite transporter (DMT)-like permease
LIGLTYAASSLLAFQTIVIHGDTKPTALFWLSVAGIGLMLTIPSIAYRIIEKPKKNG